MHRYLIALVLVVVVLLLDVLLVVLEKQLPPLGLVTVQGEVLGINLRKVRLNDVNYDCIGDNWTVKRLYYGSRGVGVYEREIELLLRFPHTYYSI